ncbi:MAG: hypothetical protein LBP60_07570, partial [Spirochaetaceae bacterium]|nr:hypothetical protein [Spirochaetaceae bacterium]
MKKVFPGMAATVLQVIIHPPVLIRGLRCIAIILKKFFFFQFKSALFPGRVPVSWIKHELDDRIPFNPRFVRIYLDFTGFWIRIVGFLCIRYPKKGPAMAVDFINSISRLYLFAFQIYRKNLSTTTRPRYTKTFYFRLIHLLDPHLMCLPSLHVMIVIQTYIRFREYVRTMGEAEALGSLTERVLAGALRITDAVLYVKQHSINCVAAALYTMNRLYPSRFTAADAETFAYGLFKSGTGRDIPPEYAPFYTGDLVSPEDIAWLREHIISLYRFFLETETGNWKRPLLAYLSHALEKQCTSLYIFTKKDYLKGRLNGANGEKNMADDKSLVSRVVELGGREATVLENTNLRVMIDDIGGMVPELSGRRSGNGDDYSTHWINAHWMPWFRSNTGKPYSDAEHGSFWKANLLYHIAGSFPCIPSFGPGHIAEGVPMPPHGWTSNQKWRYVT